jgi:toxin-antitoxin system PIN domain toxin
VIVPDANLLLYAYDSNSDLQPSASRWLRQILSGPDTVGLSWLSIGAFLRIATNSKLGLSQLPIALAIDIVEEWLARRAVRLIVPGEGHWMILKEMLIAGRVQGPVTTDAQIAALTIEYGGVLYTNDRDFARFPGLRWVNPLLKP